MGERTSNDVLSESSQQKNPAYSWDESLQICIKHCEISNLDFWHFFFFFWGGRLTWESMGVVNVRYLVNRWS